MANRPLVTAVLIFAIAVPLKGIAAGADTVSSVTTAPGSSSSSSAAPPPVGEESSYAGESNAAKAHALVNAAINMTDSDRAVKLLWQATDLDPTLDEAYVYLGLFYNSRSQFDRVVQVYQKLIKFQPKEVSAYLNIGEAYMSFTPPNYDAALPYYRKAFQLDPTSSFAALRIGEIYAEQGNRGEAVRYLKLASADRTKNPTIAQEADRIIRQMGAS